MSAANAGIGELDAGTVEELNILRDWAYSLAALVDEWLQQRETYRAQQAEEAEARECRARAELSRGPRP